MLMEMGWLNQNKITLCAARENLAITLEEAANQINLSPEELLNLERDNTQMQCDVAVALSRLYYISVHHLYIGKQENFNIT
jgi:DNA-binding XRE family transcriptional regulator